ncbi:MAG: hypothetical protein M1835_001758 [Candelina submexicana]|nr:MAG: hypothetical protein M1835_001758 [Candelina submexicana]
MDGFGDDTKPPRKNKEAISPDVELIGETPPSPLVGIRLRQYQEECIQSVLYHLNLGHKRLGISLATGSGKTVIFTQLIDRVPPPNKNATQTIIFVHRRELVEQAARHCIEAYPSKTVEIEMGTTHATGKADITIASVRSFIGSTQETLRRNKFDPACFKLVLVDEAHHIVANSYMQALSHFGVDKGGSPDTPALVGVSATLSRFDGLKLGAAIDHVVYHKDYVDMIGEKWLSDVIFTTVHSKAKISNVKAGATGDFNATELSKAVNTDHANEITVRSWLARAGDRKSTLVFCVDIAHLKAMTEKFRKHGIDARRVHGNTPPYERHRILQEFKEGKFPMLLNCGVFTEGTDIPNIDCVLLTRPTRSRNLLVQMIGRGMRLHDGKKNCHIIDMVASLGTGIVSTPTLFGLDPLELVYKADMNDLKDLAERREHEAKDQAPSPKGDCNGQNSPSGPLTGKVTFTDYDSVHDLIEDSSGERHIRALSLLAWVEVGINKYVLSPSNGDILVIEKHLENFYTLNITRKLHGKSSPYMRPQQIATAETFSAIVHAADTFAVADYPYIFIAKNKPWRDKPASEGQLKMLNQFRKPEDKLTPDDVTKGKAGDMITKLKFGARGRFDKLEGAKRRKAKEDARIERLTDMSKREQVRVGPVAA